MRYPMPPVRTMSLPKNGNAFFRRCASSGVAVRDAGALVICCHLLLLFCLGMAVDLTDSHSWVDLCRRCAGARQKATLFAEQSSLLRESSVGRGARAPRALRTWAERLFLLMPPVGGSL